MKHLLLPAALLAAAASLGLYFFRENTRLQVRHYTVSNSKLKGKCRIAFLSDLHENSFGEENERLLAAIYREAPDLVLIGGDMAVAGNHSNYSVAARLVRSISGHFPVYHALGNHECKGNPDSFAAYKKELLQSGVCFLDNSSELFVTPTGSRLRLWGLTLSLSSYYGRLRHGSLKPEDISRIAGESDRNEMNILLAHNPDYFDAYAGWEADLILSGHLHGGMVRLPFVGGCVSPGFFLFPKYAGGHFQVTTASGKTSDMLVSCGLGNHTIKVRFRNPPELLIVDLVPSL